MLLLVAVAIRRTVDRSVTEQNVSARTSSTESDSSLHAHVVTCSNTVHTSERRQLQEIIDVPRQTSSDPGFEQTA